MVTPTAKRYRDVLVLAQAPDAAEQHSARSDMYATAERLDGRCVLLLDDTWTTGAHAQSGASALKQAGARAVGVLALGRHFQPQQQGEHGEAAKGYLTRARALGWQWERCSNCAST
jgi:adenine/guanine phosphoribosyltransferase-like PRPP-binding protein